MKPQVAAFFDEPTFTASYVVSDPATKMCAIVDSVLDFDPSSGKTDTKAAEKIVDHIRRNGLTVEWILETHVHADHLSAAPLLKEKLGGKGGKGIAKTKCPKCQQKMGNVPLYTLKSLTEAPTTQPAADDAADETGPADSLTGSTGVAESQVADSAEASKE